MQVGSQGPPSGQGMLALAGIVRLAAFRNVEAMELEGQGACSHKTSLPKTAKFFLNFLLTVFWQ